MEFAGILLGKGIALPFYGVHMYHHRAVQFLGPLQNIAQAGQVVAVDRPQISEAHILKQRAPRPKGLFQGGFDLVIEAVNAVLLRVLAEKAPVPLLEVIVRRFGPQAGQMPRHGPDVGIDGHSVVVQNHDQRLMGSSGVVQALIGKSAGQRPVADERQDTVIFLL